MLAAVLREFPKHDLLIMAAAVADYRPVAAARLSWRGRASGCWNWNRPPTSSRPPDASNGPTMGTVGFSLETTPDPQRVRDKLRQKKLDLIVYNAVETISSELIQPTLFFADGSEEKLPSRPKGEFADILIQRSAGLFD